MLEIAFHVQAEAEMLTAAAYYEKQATGLGSDFLDDVERGAHRIQQFPYSWATYEGEYRRYLLQRFPYGLIYRIASEQIFIVAVAHLRRKPGYWKTREQAGS